MEYLDKIEDCLLLHLELSNLVGIPSHMLALPSLIGNSILYSSAYISGIPGMANDLHMANETVALLGLTTYLLGFAAGSLLWAPLSETYGRRPVYIATLIPATLFVIGCALSKNAAAMLITRFFAGMLGCTALSNSPGSINDVIAPKNRALAFSCWGLGVMVRDDEKMYMTTTLTKLHRMVQSWVP